VLSGVSPSAPHIDRDRLMFLAGQASVQGSEFRVQDSESEKVHARQNARWFWPASTAALAATSLALALALLARPVAGPQVVYIERPEPVDTSTRKAESTAVVAALPVPAGTLKVGLTVPSDNYLRTREVALRMGLDAIGAPRAGGPASAIAPTYGNLLQGLDETQRRSPEAAPWFETLLNM